MQFYFLGASVFFFASALALYAYSAYLLGRAIHILKYSLSLLDDLKGGDPHGHEN